MKKKDLAQERGRLLTEFVTLETCVSMIIAGHYFGDPSQIKIKNDFQFHVLENTRFNWSLKREILGHILRADNLDGSNLGDLDRLNAFVIFSLIVNLLPTKHLRLTNQKYILLISGIHLINLEIYSLNRSKMSMQYWHQQL